MTKKVFLCVFIVLFLSNYILAQHTITGTVSDESGPLPGVTVTVKNTTRGVSTDFDGNYSISTNSGDTLVFSYIGKVSQEVLIDTQTTINIILISDSTKLEEVVVVGYGTSSKEALTGSVEVLKSEKFEMAPTTSLENSLQGNVAGLQMGSSDGQPGSNAQVRIRGIGSFTASSAPLYVVDGIPVVTGSFSETDFGNGERSSNVMSTINPNDIASVSVLKDASATAIYGSRGANGVIIITTKRGKSGKAKINFNNQIGFSNPAYNNLHKSLNEEDYHTLFIEGYVNNGKTVAYAQDRYDKYYPEPANTNWLDAIQRQGVTQQYNIDASGGGDKINYFASGSYFDQEGIFVGTDFERFSSRLNLTVKASDKLTLTNNIAVGRTKATGAPDGTAWDNPIYGAYLVPAAVPVLDDNKLYYAGHKSFMMGGANPVGELLEDDRWMKQLRIIDNISAAYKIINDLTFKSAWGFDLLNINEYEYDNGRYGDGRRVEGRANEASINNMNWIGTQTLNYNKSIADDHNVDLLLGYEAQKNKKRSMEIQGERFPHPSLRTLANTANPTLATSKATKYSFVSMFSRLSYNYKNKYYATLSYRRDGSSRFGVDNRWGNFWSVGGSWRIDQEDFMTDISWIDNLKLRASYGVTGNAGIKNFAALSLYRFDYDYAGTPGSAPSNVGNPKLTWEGQENLDIGIELSIFNSIKTSVTYFNKKSTDLLLERPLSLTVGFDNNLQNVGDMQNTGLEIEANATVINSNDLNWDIGANITFIKNEITKLNEPIIDNPFRRKEGRDFYEYYMWHWAGVNPENGDGLWYADETMTTTTNEIKNAKRFYTGKSATPDFFGGVNTSFKYKRLELSAQFTFVWNKYLYDNSDFVLKGDGRYTPRSTTQAAFDNRWTTPGQESVGPKFFWGNKSGSNSKNSTRSLYDATYVRLRDVTLTYNLPTSIIQKLNISSLKLYFKGTNILTWVRDRENLHIDPESGVNGLVNGLIPKFKTLSFGLNVGF